MSVSRINDIFNISVAALNNTNRVDTSKFNDSKTQNENRESYEQINVSQDAGDRGTFSEAEGLKEEKYIKRVLCLIWVMMLNAYYLAYFNIETLEGNMFVNGIILGCAEVMSNFASGLLLLSYKEDTALRICCAVAAVANGLLLFVTSDMLSYVVLFFAMGGLGGIYNSLFVVIEMQVSPTSLGSVMQLVLTVGAIGNSLVSVMGAAPQPWPVIMTVGFSMSVFGLSLLLPEGGKFLQKAVQVSESVTVMDVAPLQHTIHESILMISNMHTMTFNETFREKRLGAQRPRLNESRIDPDLLNLDLKEVTKIIDRWKFDGVDESQLINMTQDMEKWR